MNNPSEIGANMTAPKPSAGAREMASEQAIRQIKKKMRRLGIRKISCFNGGLSSDEYSYNSELFRLSVEAERAQ